MVGHSRPCDTAVTEVASRLGPEVSALMSDVVVPEVALRRDALRVSALSKTFGATRALDEVGIDIRAGEILALVGQNGSGKSTLIKSLAGYHHPDHGAVAELDGTAFHLGHEVPERLRFVHQDLGLVQELSAQDNLALRGGFATGPGGRVLWREQEAQTRRILERFDVDIDIHQPVGGLSPVERAVVAIAGALQGWSGDAGGVLVLDEPTAVLPHDEVERLFAVVREVRRAGTAVLYVSHRMDEIFELADRVTILRSGRLIGTYDIPALTAGSLASLMSGEEVDPDYRASVDMETEAPVILQARNVSGRWLRGVDLQVRKGEILGIAGLAGAGTLELPYVLSGHGERSLIKGELRQPHRSDHWIPAKNAAKLDIPLVPADRQSEGVIAEFSVAENLSLSVLDRLSRLGTISKKKEAHVVSRWSDRLKIKTENSRSPISTLSGGNQQKVVLARCLAADPEILVLCEPTAGVDIGTRVAIYERIAQLASDGLTVIVSSSDEGDLLAMCTRILVLRGGVVSAEMDGREVTKPVLVRAIEGD